VNQCPEKGYISMGERRRVKERKEGKRGEKYFFLNESKKNKVGEWNRREEVGKKEK
jgi:hypothetical protein